MFHYSCFAAMRIYISIGTVLFVLLFFSCGKQEEIIIPPEPISYLALGDSYTIGQGVEVPERWPYQLRERLIAEEYEVVKTDILAQTGWKTGDLLTAIADNQLAGYNLVSLLIGVNNQFWGGPYDTFTQEFDILLNQSIEMAGSKERVFVMSIPDYGVTPYGSNNSEAIAQSIDLYNSYIQQKCMEEEIIFINITDISRELGDSPGALSSDDLHPSGNQYAQWVDRALPEVLGILEE